MLPENRPFPNLWARLPPAKNKVMSQKPTKRIYLSVPHMGGAELTYVQEAFASNWLSTVGPNLDALETKFSNLVGLPSVALATGTAGIHLAHDAAAEASDVPQGAQPIPRNREPARHLITEISGWVANSVWVKT